MEKRISSLTLLCLVLSGVGAIQVTIPKTLFEFARGDNMILPCSFTPKNPIGPKQIVVISWSALSPDVDPQSILTYYYNPDPSLDIDSGYEGRASLDVNVLEGKADLKLLSLTLADNKTYECHVQIQGDSTGKPVAITRVMVLVAPSPPICKIQGTAEYGQDITLSCASAEGSPAPTYKWDRRNVQNISVPQDPKTTDKGGILSLYNITKDTSGYYICTSANKIRSATCNLTLSVMPPSMKIGSTAGIIGGVVAVLILLVIIILCCCCRKKKKNNNEDYAMGDHEEYTDKQVDRPVESQPLEDSNVKSTDRFEERSEPGRRDYDDRRSDYDDRRSDYDDRRPRDYDDRRPRDYDDRRSRDYDDRRSDYDDRRSDYDDRRPRDYDDRRYQDRRRDDAGDRERPPVPNSKPPRRDYD